MIPHWRFLRKAMRLHRVLGPKPPAILYKYFPPERIDVLETGKIRFTQPCLFNDPFESAPAYLELFRPREFERTLRAQAMQTSMPEETRLAVSRYLNAGPSAEALKRLCASLLIDLMGRCMGILSLTEKNDNLLMWAHYAQCHEGFVVGVTTADPFFSQTGEEKHVPNYLGKVRYSRKRPRLKYLTEFGLAEVYFTKSQQWVYEQEWRVFRPTVAGDAAKVWESVLTWLSEPDHLPTLPDYPVRLYGFPSSSVSRVILGCRASEETSKAIAAVVKARYPGAKLLKAQRDTSKFRLMLRPMMADGAKDSPDS